MSDQLREAIEAEGGLVNTGDISRLWDVTPSGVGHVLERDDAPRPVGYVSTRKWPVWTRADVLAYREEVPR